MDTALALNTQVSTVFLVALRMSAMLMMTPVFYAIQMPATVRVLLVLALSTAIAIGLPPSAAPQTNGAGALFGMAVSEAALGATLGLGILVAFASFSVAGRLLDVQVGFGLAQVFDPVTRRQIPVLSAMFEQVGVLVFFLLNGHLALFRGFALSLERFPLGSASWSAPASADALLGQVGGLFALGLALVAPVVFCVLLVDMALGVVARNLPQMNMFVVALPTKIVVAIVGLAIWFNGIGPAMERIYASIGTTWSKLMAVAPVATVGAQ